MKSREPGWNGRKYMRMWVFREKGATER